MLINLSLRGNRTNNTEISFAYLVGISEKNIMHVWR